MIDLTAMKAMIAEVRQSGDFNTVCSNIPYARKIGMECQKEGSTALFLLPANDANIGNPVLPAIHGGVVGGFMEMSAAIHLMLFMDEPRTPKIIDFSLDYLRSCKLENTYAQCDVTRQGKRVANVSITAWQSNKEKPVAIARGHFKLGDQ